MLILSYERTINESGFNERRRYEGFLLCSPIFLNSCEIISLRYKKDGCGSWDWEKESKVMLQTRK